METPDTDWMRHFALKVPTATWDDVGGLRPVKRALRELIELPLRRPELLAKFGMPAAKGALLYGPPGEQCTRSSRKHKLL